MRHILLLTLLPVLYSCNNTSHTYALRDSVTNRYLSSIDTSGQYDTSELNYKVLKAYIANDTAFFRQFGHDVEKASSNRQNWDLWNSDVPLPKIQTLPADEAYRFIFSVLGSSSYVAVTITNQSSSIKLYYNHFKRDVTAQKPPEITASDSANLTSAQWDELLSRLRFGDFWGLKKENHIRGDDGSDLTVIGYRKEADGSRPKYQYVHRFYTSTLNDAFFYVFFTLLDKKHKPY